MHLFDVQSYNSKSTAFTPAIGVRRLKYCHAPGKNCLSNLQQWTVSVARLSSIWSPVSSSWPLYKSIIIPQRLMSFSHLIMSVIELYIYIYILNIEDISNWIADIYHWTAYNISNLITDISNWIADISNSVYLEISAIQLRAHSCSCRRRACWVCVLWCVGRPTRLRLKTSVAGLIVVAGSLSCAEVSWLVCTSDADDVGLVCVYRSRFVAFLYDQQDGCASFAIVYTCWPRAGVACSKRQACWPCI